MENEDVPSSPSTPATPGTPGAPLFGGVQPAIVNQKTQGSETLIGLAASTGLAVMIVILSTGHISGAHLNPAVTIAFSALKHFPWKHVPVYIGAQVMASLCAAFALKGVFHPIMGGGVTVPSGGFVQAFAMEFIISFNLMFVITAVATDTRAINCLNTVKFTVLVVGRHALRATYPCSNRENERVVWHMHVPTHRSPCPPGDLVGRHALRMTYPRSASLGFSRIARSVAFGCPRIAHSDDLGCSRMASVGELAGIAVGATVMLNILIAGPFTGASMNPVRTLGPAITAKNYKGIWVYFSAPILGALCGAGTYTAVKLPEEDGEKPSNLRSFRR
ncbi:Aquaporin NIP3-1 [Hibiscus syriacus]|uniref:Aquaporin NIP3-1 n=1 Tax=Hibiscus syriacus TaxID=106335 RepID=A0A6A3A871_HIBSY|nr:Aquaporin NIP3-1 [Hibiscus syriacus]